MEDEIVERIFEIFNSFNVKPATELKYVNNFTLLVAVVLSAQATDASVNKATSELFKIYNKPSLMIELGEDGLKRHIKSINFFQAKAKNVMLLCKQLIEKYDGEVPNSFEDLIKLAGVGRKTANVVLSTLFNIPTIAVDTHVFRVSKRIGLASGDTPLKVELELYKIIDKKWLNNAHHWLVLHGRYICIARNPRCGDCPINQYCEYFAAVH